MNMETLVSFCLAFGAAAFTWYNQGGSHRAVHVYLAAALYCTYQFAMTGDAFAFIVTLGAAAMAGYALIAAQKEVK
jgi:hypothetical protein